MTALHRGYVCFISYFSNVVRTSFHILGPLHDVFRHLRGILWSVVIILLMIIVSYALYYETFPKQYKVELEPIHVPRRLVETGVTARVAGQHFIDAVHQIYRVVEAHYKPGELTPTWEKPNLSLPSTRLSIQDTATFLRRLLPTRTKRAKVSGELIHTGSDNGFSLHLRFTENSYAQKTPRKKRFTGLLDHILEQGARWIIETIDPYALAAYYYSRDEYAIARKLSSLIVMNYKGKESEVWAVNLLGLLHSHEAQYVAAIGKYERALALDPNFGLAYHNWGYALFADGKHEAAITKYEKATEVNPVFPDTYYEWGNALQARGKYDAAIEKYEKAIELKPNFPDAYYEWGNALYFKDDYRGVVAKYQKAIDGDPETYKYLEDTFDHLLAIGD